MAKHNKRVDLNFTSSQSAIKQIASIKPTTPRSGLKGAIDRARAHKINKMKINKISDLGKSSQKVSTRAIDAAKDVAKTYIATETAKDLQRNNGLSSSLQAWTRNISGNPDKSIGQDGKTQEGSTTDMFNELGGI